jgi:predicted hydrocarbon binding protein
MKLFKKKKENIIQNQENTIIIPKKLKTYNSNILNTFLNTFISMTDFETYHYFTSQIAKNFYEQNKTYIESLSKIENGNIQLIWENLNTFLKLNNLGTSQITVDLKNKNINILHYNSLFVKHLHNKTSHKLCNFYASLYSLILSNILEMNIRIIEKECGNETNKNFCIFTTTQ